MSERARWSRGDWLTMAGSALIVVLVAVLIAAVLVGIGGGSSAQAATLEPAAQSGVDPFTASVQIGPAVSLSQPAQAVTVVARSKLAADPKTHTLIAPATAPGLYGGSGDTHVCDPDQLVTFLQQHPGKAAAWGAVLGVSAGDIATYVASLTPVVLTNDTLVTNHGYRNGKATTLTSVLQAGTAVMVDSYGVPRLKCNCGNPLTQPRPINPADFRGHAWAGYAPTQVTVVHSTTQITNITVINVATGRTYTQPTGSASQFIASKDAVIYTSNDGTKWTQATSIPDRANALVSGGGKLLAVADSVGQTIVWNVQRNGSTHIAILPGTSASVAFGSGRWVLSTVTSGASGETGSIYTSTDATNWTKTGVTVATTPFESGTDGRVPIAYGNGQWLAVGGGAPRSVYTSGDGSHWSRTRSAAGNGHALSLAFGAGEWALGTDNGVITSRDAITWVPSQQTALGGLRIFSIVYGNGKWLATGVAEDAGSPAPPTLYSSTDATQWASLEQSMVPDALAFGATLFGNAPSTPPTSTTVAPATPTTAASAGGIENVDFRNYTYLDRTCGTFSGKHDPVRLVNGKYEGTDGYSNPPGTPDCGMTIDDVQFADVTGDGVKDAVVTGDAASENLQPWTLVWTTVFMATPSGPKNIGYLDGYAYPPYSAAAGINLWSGEMGSVRCCAATYGRTTYKYSGGKLVKTAQATSLPPSAAPAPVVKMMGGSG